MQTVHEVLQAVHPIPMTNVGQGALPIFRLVPITAHLWCNAVQMEIKSLMSEDEAAAMNGQLRDRGSRDQLHVQYVPAAVFTKADGDDDP